MSSRISLSPELSVADKLQDEIAKLKAQGMNKKPRPKLVLDTDPMEGHFLLTV